MITSMADSLNPLLAGGGEAIAENNLNGLNFLNRLNHAYH